MQTAALLIAAKRADAVASEMTMHTEHNTEDVKTLLGENTALTRAMNSNTDLREEVQRDLTQLTPQAGSFPSNSKPRI